MAQQGLTEFMVGFIAGRRQAKLDAFDKDVARRLAAADENLRAGLQVELSEQRRALELRYETRAWLSDAANRAGQISLVTHAAKFTHGDSKSSSIFTRTTASEGYLSTATIVKPAADAVGNSAALDVAKLLQTEVNGDSLLDCLKRGDSSPLAELAETDVQLAEWIDGFSRTLTTKQPTSHKLAKQIYFPVGEGYHLLSPLFSSSLAQAMHQRMVDLRFSEETKEIWKARREKRWHPQPLVQFPDTAVINYGGTKPQNISALNSGRGGRVWLLSCAPPQWEPRQQPPLNKKTFFAQGPFERRTRDIRRKLIDLVSKTGDARGYEIRRARDRYIDQIIDILFNQAAEIQRYEWKAWTQKEKCLLKPHQQLWLDPYRATVDEIFRHERDKDEWQGAVAEDFAMWLKSHLREKGLNVGDTENKEWQTKTLFSRRLREMEQAIRSYRDE